jgi:asparagine synthase (glutamine-hydrolysing)
LKTLAHDVLLDSTTLARGYFRDQTVRQMLADHTAGIANHAQGLWMLLVFELWHREWAK